ncbi:HAD-IA family hydrolase [Nocardioides caricicola]|uniref:HAD family hydrolase n=1 Tax=Nocardioides caricicola TaxID=634770 RepID=A0ABW0MZW8_9ACTN
MPRYDACLIDVYETVVTMDQVRHLELLAERAGASPDDFCAQTGTWAERVTDGRAPLPEAMAAVLEALGRPAGEDAAAALADADRELIVELATLPEDTVPFLEGLRAAGVRTAFVSNCNENTRHLLDGLGLTGLVDELVLSCEVGVAKPDPRIYGVALDRLDVPPERAVLVDDLASYCESAEAFGMASVRIDRAGGTGDVDTLAGLAERLAGPT